MIQRIALGAAAIVVAVMTVWAQAPEGAGAAKGKAGKGKAAQPEAPLAPPPVPQVLRLVRQNTYLVTGHGSNSVFRVTPAGVILVDTKLPNAGDYERLMELIRGVTTQPVKFVINTSSKPASSGNNAKFQAAGAEIVTTERTLTLGDAQVRTIRAGDGLLVYFAVEKLLCLGEGAVAGGANLDWTLAVPAVGEPVYRK
jgi:glyoxylase-like metal-dependent hydrolase (beta-lactamase superfamily II)